MNDHSLRMPVDLDQLPGGCLITSPNQEIIFANQFFQEVLRWQPEALVGQNMNVLLKKATQLFFESYVVPTVFREGRCCDIFVSFSSQDGRTCPMVASVQKMLNGNLAWVLLEAENRDRLFNELVLTRAAVQREREKLEQKSRTDELTGLSNLRDLEALAQRVFLDAHRSGAAVSVLILDMDRLKSINDTYGHAVGDQAICVLADALRRICRKSDIVARLGGDEFVCVLNSTDASAAGVLCERIHLAVADATVDRCPFTVSIGLAVMPSGSPMAFPDILKLADQCLYAVKKSGRNATRLVTANSA